jgi:predicted GIY-YIG superfamily endonuclease
MNQGYGGRSPLDNHRWKVYILRCADSRYYVGKTNNLEDRLERHQKGHVSFTSTRLPFELVTYIDFHQGSVPGDHSFHFLTPKG